MGGMIDECRNIVIITQQCCAPRRTHPKSKQKVRYAIKCYHGCRQLSLWNLKEQKKTFYISLPKVSRARAHTKGVYVVIIIQEKVYVCGEGLNGAARYVPFLYARI